MKNKPRGQKSWSRDEMRVIANKAGKVSPDLIVEEINTTYGNNRTLDSIKGMASTMGFSLAYKAVISDTIAGFVSQTDKIAELEVMRSSFDNKEIKKLEAKYSSLSEKYEKLRNANYSLKKKCKILSTKREAKSSILFNKYDELRYENKLLKRKNERLLSNRESRLNMLVKLLIKGSLSISNKDIAELLLVDVAYIDYVVTKEIKAMVA